jgi:hypothetical protein
MHAAQHAARRARHVGGFDERIVRAGIEPRMTATHRDDVQLTPFEVLAIHVGDLEFATRRRLHVLRDFDDALVVEVQAGHGVAGLRLRGFLLDRLRAALCIE